MKQYLHISATFDQPELVQNLVEQLAYRRYELGFLSICLLLLVSCLPVSKVKLTLIN